MNMLIKKLIQNKYLKIIIWQYNKFKMIKAILILINSEYKKMKKNKNYIFHNILIAKVLYLNLNQIYNNKFYLKKIHLIKKK
jgi:hypothetical protein